MNDAALYGLSRPTVDDARTAIHRIHGEAGPQVWEQLEQSAGPAQGYALERLLTVMATADPTTRLCALALQIRLSAHTYLCAPHSLAGGRT
ncbi:hypothetical protein [Actinoplanes sp. GCM10030250]|uniref:hypothetical protein n=1 Tax=Actinoplanes sp. GCM10030250 TaxID=3273376 RepID=UPI00361BD5E0